MGSENIVNILRDIFRYKNQVNMQYGLNIKSQKDNYKEIMKGSIW